MNGAIPTQAVASSLGNCQHRKPRLFTSCALVPKLEADIRCLCLRRRHDIGLGIGPAHLFYLLMACAPTRREPVLTADHHL